MPAPSMKPVRSSNIASIGYDEASGKLYVSFRSGGTYAYDNVPPGVFEDFMSAPSKGAFFASDIKDQYLYGRA